MRRIPPALVIAALAMLTLPAAGQSGAVAQRSVQRPIDSGTLTNRTPRRAVIYSTTVEEPGAPWMRLHFDRIDLGAAPIGGRPTELRLTSLLDGAVQHLDTASAAQWKRHSAYFNGDAVRVEVIADAGAADSVVALDRLTVGEAPQGGVATICGDDDRAPSSDPATGRLYPPACTAWMIDDANHGFLSAGHCDITDESVMQFNVPLSSGSGGLQHPDPSDQYPLDLDSVQLQDNGAGADWMYFGCHPNSETGLTAFQAQGAYFRLAPAPPTITLGQLIRITGYGADNSPSEWNQIQQTHLGPYDGVQGSVIRYRTDTRGGNSGSAVYNVLSGFAIGIHTNGGCGPTEGSNFGCPIDQPSLQAALAAPQGVCADTPCPADLTHPVNEVDVDDVLFVVNRWGQPGHAIGDVNRDGAIDVDDILAVVNQYGPCPQP